MKDLPDTGSAGNSGRSRHTVLPSLVVLVCLVFVASACTKKPASSIDALRAAADATVAGENFQARVSFSDQLVWTVAVEDQKHRLGIFNSNDLMMRILLLGSETYVSVIEPADAFCSIPRAATLVPDPIAWVEEIGFKTREVQRTPRGLTFVAQLEGYGRQVQGSATIADDLLTSIELRDPGIAGEPSTMALKFSRHGSVSIPDAPPETKTLPSTSPPCRSLRELIEVFGPTPGGP